MDENVDGIDRTGRVVIGVTAGIAGIAALTGDWAAGAVVGGVALVVGTILLVTGPRSVRSMRLSEPTRRRGEHVVTLDWFDGL